MQSPWCYRFWGEEGGDPLRLAAFTVNEEITATGSERWRLIHSPAVTRGMDGMDGNGHLLAKKRVLSYTMSHHVT